MAVALKAFQKIHFVKTDLTIFGRPKQVGPKILPLKKSRIHPWNGIL
jgi:hypothetical protein